MTAYRTCSAAGILLALIPRLIPVVPAAGVARLQSAEHTRLLRAAPSRRLEAASRKYLGTPYRLFPLGEGSAERGSPKPLIDERCVDCMTFVEQVLAHALAPTPSEVEPLLQRIRYRAGEVRFDSRNHYFLADWAPNNARLVADATRHVGRTSVRTTRKVLDRGLPVKSAGVARKWLAGMPSGGARTAFTVSYIPVDSVARSIPRFPDAAIVAFVSPRAGVDASHVGFVFRQHGWTLRHASLTRGRVVDEPFLPYLKRRGRQLLGVAVFTVRPEVAL